MRQMRIHADRVITPDSPFSKPNSGIGSRPNFNIDYENKKSYFCKPGFEHENSNKK